MGRREEMVQDALNEPAETWYRSNCCAKTRAECFAQGILSTEGKLDELMNGISPVRRGHPYFVAGHDGETEREDSNRKEERLALKLFRNYGLDQDQRDLGDLGKVVDYQVPLKGKQEDVAGKVDLVCYHAKSQVLSLVELKAPGSGETLIRAVLEIYTYLKQIGQEKLKQEFDDKYGKMGGVSDIQAAILVEENSCASLEYSEDVDSYTRQLMDKLGVKLYPYTEGFESA